MARACYQVMCGLRVTYACTRPQDENTPLHLAARSGLKLCVEVSQLATTEWEVAYNFSSVSVV